MSNLDLTSGLQARGFAPQTNEQRAQQGPDDAFGANSAAERVALERALLVGGIAGVASMGQAAPRA